MATAYSSLAFSISPCAKRERKKNQDDDEAYVLTLAPFTRPPKISFGTVKVNESVEKALLIVNPQDFRMELNVMNSELNINNIKISIDKGETITLKLKWEPTKPDNYRYTINFEVLNSLKLKFVVHAYGVCEKIDPKKKGPIKRAPFKVLQPLKTKKEEEATTAAAGTSNTASVQPNEGKTIVMRSNQENSRPKVSIEVHNQTRVIEKPKASTFKYDDDFYRNDFNYTSSSNLLDVTTTAASTTSCVGPINSTHLIDRRQTSVISTPKLNLYRSMDCINLTSSSLASNAVSFGIKSPPLRRSTSVREIYMEETIIKGVSGGASSDAIDEAGETETTMIHCTLPDSVHALLMKKKQQTESPGTPKLSGYLRTPCARGRGWVQAHEQDHRAKYAVMCQRAYRMKRFRIRLRMLKLMLEQTRAALVVQRQWRIKMFRRRMRRFRRAATTIQMWFRRVREQRMRAEFERRIWFQRVELFTKVMAAKKIQRSFRNMRIRRAEFEKKRLHAVIMVQSQWRMILVQRRSELKLKAIKTIQIWYRKKRTKRLEYRRRLLAAVIMTQSRWRMILAMRQYRTKMKSAILIQTWYRGSAARQRLAYKKMLVAAVLIIQSNWRMILQRRKYTRMVQYAKVIQRWYRRILRRRAEYQKKLLKAVVSVQSHWRMIVARRKYAAKIDAIKRIQQWYKYKRAKRLEYERRLLKAVILVQSRCRMILARREYKSKTRYRGMAARGRLAQKKKQVEAAISIQTQWRMICARRRFKTIVESTRLIQKWYRSNRERRVNASATLIQATWRGYVARKKYFADKKLRQQQQQQKSRQQQTRRSATTMADQQSRTLGDRIKSSLQLLMCPAETNIPLWSIICSLNDLHTVTRLSPECCEIFVRESATDVLFGFIANCNRSVPHMDMIKLCLDILLNLARYYKTVTQICTGPAAFPTLLNLLQAYQLSNSAIFMNVCVIMVLLHRHACLGDQEMMTVGGRDKLFSKLFSIHLALEKRRQAATKTTPASTPKKFVFSLEPEWQLSKTCQSIEFTDSLNALEMLMSELGMRHAAAVSASAAVVSSTRRPIIPRREAQTPVVTSSNQQRVTRGAAQQATIVSTAARKIEYAATTTATTEISEHTIISNADHNTSVLSNVTIRSVSGFFNEEPHLNSTRYHH